MFGVICAVAQRSARGWRHLAGAGRSLRGQVFGPRAGGAPPCGAGGDDGGAVLARVGVFGEVEDVPGDVGAGDGLHGEPGAGVNVPGERSIGQFDGAQRVPVELGGGEFFLHGLKILADAAQIGGDDALPISRRGPAPMAASPGPMLPVLTEISLAGAPGSFMAVMRVRASRWWRSGGEIIVVLGLWRLAKLGPRAVTTTSAPWMAWAAKPGSKMSGLTRISAWPAGGTCGAA